jgi:hypothetical protein
MFEVGYQQTKVLGKNKTFNDLFHWTLPDGTVFTTVKPYTRNLEANSPLVMVLRPLFHHVHESVLGHGGTTPLVYVDIITEVYWGTGGGGAVRAPNYFFYHGLHKIPLPRGFFCKCCCLVFFSKTNILKPKSDYWIC